MAKGCEWCGISHDIKIAQLLNINIMYEHSIKTYYVWTFYKNILCMNIL